MRAKVYKVAEEFHAKTSPDVAKCNGIRYEDNNLKVQLAFRTEEQCENFQSAIRGMPMDYRKRQLSTSDDELAIADEITEMKLEKTLFGAFERVFFSHYSHTEDDSDQSPPCDIASDFSATSYVSTVWLTEETRLRLVNCDGSLTSMGEKPEKCHLMSQTKHPEHKDDPNNILIMSRDLHQQFDGLNMCDGVPHFILEYVQHDRQSIERNFTEGGRQRTKHVFETVVRVTFLNEGYAAVLIPHFKDGTVQGSTCFKFPLYFEDPDAFRDFAAHKANETRLKWASVVGPEGIIDRDD